MITPKGNIVSRTLDGQGIETAGRTIGNMFRVRGLLEELRERPK